MIYALVAAGLVALYMLYLKIKGFFLSKKDANLTNEIKDAKNEAAKKVDDANVSYDDFERKLRDYKSKKD